jgi:hypothetical protein
MSFMCYFSCPCAFYKKWQNSQSFVTVPLGLLSQVPDFEDMCTIDLEMDLVSDLSVDAPNGCSTSNRVECVSVNSGHESAGRHQTGSGRRHRQQTSLDSVRRPPVEDARHRTLDTVRHIEHRERGQ